MKLPRKKKILVVSPGVLPIPPSMGGAVENLIFNLHNCLYENFDFSYISVIPPKAMVNNHYLMPNAQIYYVDSINVLEDFTPENNFELSESSKSKDYEEFVTHIAKGKAYDVIHVHNEAYLVKSLRNVAPQAKIILHVNDEVVSRMQKADLYELCHAVNEIVACSNFIQHSILDSFRIARQKPCSIRVIYNGVDTKVYNRNKLNQTKLEDIKRKYGAGDKPVIIFVGRVIEEKGPHLAIRAFRKVKENFADAQLFLVGAPWYSRLNKSRFIDYLMNECDDLSNSIKLIGYVNQEEMPYYYAIANIVVCPSIWDDPSPFVAYEAQAMGVPLIAGRHGGLPEIIEHGVTGYCIDPFNIALFATRLIELLNNEALRYKLGSEGRERIRQQFEIRLIANQIARLYLDK